MRCEEAQNWLEKLADGDAPFGAEAGLEVHLAECERCRDHRRFLAAIHTAGRAPLLLPPESYWEKLPGKVMALIEKESERRAHRWSMGRWEWVGALAAAVVAAVVGLQILRAPMVSERTPSAPPPSSAAEPEQKRDDEKAVAPGRLEQAPRSGEVAKRALPSFRQAERDEPHPGKAGARASAETVTAAAPPPPEPEAKEIPGEPAAGLAAPAPASVSQLAPKVKAEDRVVTLQPAANAVEGAPAPAAELRRRSLKARGDSADDRQQELFAQLVDRYSEPELEAPARAAGRAPAESDSLAPSLEGQAARWRDFLSRYPESRFADLARYRLALCSIRLFELRRTEEDRKRALEDASAYLALAPSGESAEKVRRGLERVKPK